MIFCNEFSPSSRDNWIIFYANYPTIQPQSHHFHDLKQINSKYNHTLTNTQTSLRLTKTEKKRKK